MSSKLSGRFSLLGTMSIGAMSIGAMLALGTGALTGCDFIDKARGLAKGAEELSEHLEKDLKAELTDDKIDKVLEVTPALTEFSEEAKVKWKIDPDQSDMSELTTMLGGLSDYFAFFESHDTRLTEYYVDTMKISDALLQIEYKAGRKEALKKLADEREELEKKADAASGKEKEKLETKLKQNELATENLEEAELKKSPSKGNKNAYKLSDDEIELVADRRKEIKKVFDEAGYIKDNSAKKKKKKSDDDEE